MIKQDISTMKSHDLSTMDATGRIIPARKGASTVIPVKPTIRVVKILLLNQRPDNAIISDLSGIHAYMIKKYLPPLGNYVIEEQCMDKLNFKTLPMYDYCIVTPICGVKKLGPINYRLLKTKVRGEVITFCENSIHKGDEDVLFHMLSPSTEGCKHVLWGADLPMLTPNKQEGKIVVLVDHQYYGKKSSATYRNDKSQAIIDSLLQYQTKDPRIVIQQICSKRVVTVTPGYKIPDSYKRTSVDFRQLYQYYRAADIFVPTHRESFGFTNVECAAAGALIAYPSPGYIHDALIKTLHSVPIGDCSRIDWAKVISFIDVKRSIEMASKYSYENIAIEIDSMVKSKMTVLVLCIGACEVTRGTNISNLTTVYSYMLRKYLSRYGQYTFTFKEVNMTVQEALDLPEYDFCIVTPPRWCTFDRPQIRAVRQKIRYKMYSLCENNKIVGDEDTLFYMIGRANIPKCIRVHWGCDFDLLKPTKIPGQINILMDHQYYGKEDSDIFQRDVTKRYVRSILELQNTRSDVKAVQIGSGRVFPIVPNYQIPKFAQTAGMDFRQLYREYCKADIFMITHPGSFGFSIVESAAAGALIVTPEGYVPPKLIKYVHHCIVDPNQIDWDKVFSSINVNLSIEKAKQYSYDHLAKAMHNDMTETKNANQ